ncbi:Puromycin-sensitive aminopeptidase [Halotydeus destructor]|nr:Puromycin-sensitive aminopeptidase [Halotydeus destructor]
MLEDWAGEEKFREGLRIYLARHKYGNTCTKHLWAALEESTGLPVARVMSGWTKQKGFPLITVSETQRSADTVYLTLSQKKFSSNNSLTMDERKVRWDIPVKYETPQASPMEHIIMSGRFKPLTIKVKSRDDWIKLNTDSIGFYRTQYSEDLLKKLETAVETKDIKAIDRCQLQSDLFALVRCGSEKTERFMEFLKAYKTEDNYFVWDSISDSIGAMDVMLSNTDYYKKLNPYVVELFKEQYANLSWDKKPDEDGSTSLKRSLIISMLGVYGYEPVVAEAKKRFAEHVRGGTQIDADLRGPIYKTVAVSDQSDDEFKQFFEMYKKADSGAEKNRIGRAMGATDNPVQVAAVLAFALTSDVRIQDSVSIITGVTGSLAGRELAWQFFKDNKVELLNRYGSDYQIGRLVQGVTAGYADEAKAQEIEAFFEENTFPGTERSLKQALESVRVKAAWKQRDGQSIETYLTNAVSMN